MDNDQFILCSAAFNNFCHGKPQCFILNPSFMSNYFFLFFPSNVLVQLTDFTFVQVIATMLQKPLYPRSSQSNLQGPPGRNGQSK